MAAIFLVNYLKGRYTSDNCSVITLCSVFMVLVGNVCLSSLGRLFSWRMTELEQTLYLNLKQMVCIQMLWAGLIDFIVLSVLVLFCGNVYGGGKGAFLLYMLMPFLWSDILYLRMLTMLRGELRGYRQLSVGLVCGIFAACPMLFENAYEFCYLPVWGIISAAGLGILVLEIRRLLGRIEGGEGLCLN